MKPAKESKVLPRKELREPGAEQPKRETHPASAIKRHKSKVAALGCYICRMLGLGITPPQLHHIREGRGMSQRADDVLVIPLCREHHQGDTGLHGLGTREFTRRYRVSELDILADTLEKIA